jgi:hypothetical protein
MADEKVAAHAKAEKPTAKQVEDFHTNADKDGSPKALHHTLGPGPNQAAAGNHTHDGGNSASLTELLSDVTISGSRATAVPLQQLLTALTKFGLKDTTTA